MKRFVAIGVVCVLLLSVTGCGSPDALMKEFIANLNGYAETLEKKESKERQSSALERIKNTTEKLDRAKLSKDEQDKMFAKYKDEFEKAKERVEKAQKALAMDGGATADAPPDLFGGFKAK